MALAKGQILVIHNDGEQIRMVVVEDIIGPVKGQGWLIITREGNMALVANYELQYVADCSFIVDGETQKHFWILAKRGG